MNEILNKTMEWFESYESQKEEPLIEEIQCKLLVFLTQKNIDIYEIMEKYKQILCNLNKYNQNYYAHICILLNLIKKKKKMGYELDKLNLEDFKYIESAIKEKLLNQMSIRTLTDEIRVARNIYEWIDFDEGIGEKKTQKQRESILKETKEILSKKIDDVLRAKKCIKDIKEYIILTYGRWSKEYERVIEIETETKGYPLTPRLAMMANKHYIQIDLTRLMEIIEK